MRTALGVVPGGGIEPPQAFWALRILRAPPVSF